MKKLAIFFPVFTFIFSVEFLLFNITFTYAGWVSGYYKNNGTYVNGYYRSAPSYRSYTPLYRNSYTQSYGIYRSYPSYRSGLRYQRGYYKASEGSWVSGHFKTYSDRYRWNNRRSLYGW